MKKMIQSLGFILFGALFALGAFVLVNIPQIKFAESEFLLGYLGIFLGFAFSVVTFVMTLVDKGRQRIIDAKNYTEDEKKESKSRMSMLISELEDIMIFLFTSFVIVVFIMIWEVVDISFIKIPENMWYSKVRLLKAVKFSIFGWSVYGIYDLLIAAFKVNERVEKIIERTEITK
ncbi:hypothetical protein [Hymenobacter yonginensis]|uniref:Uncharacterized protein n=1 Tax=Hymenobacter yonginensis TaxID=748197 RepID=A0ABY7PQ36_9BACT|nr:hypothetical protein [Hymenobacter yonginensis]WBO84772.1 hypothetical protein O9Z63_00675 [Hymenobacter yonginensis]